MGSNGLKGNAQNFDPLDSFQPQFWLILTHFDSFWPREAFGFIPAGAGPFPAVLFHKTAGNDPRNLSKWAKMVSELRPFWAILGPFWAFFGPFFGPLNSAKSLWGLPLCRITKKKKNTSYFERSRGCILKMASGSPHSDYRKFKKNNNSKMA